MRRKFQIYMAGTAKADQPAVRKQGLSAQRVLITKTDKLTGEFMSVP